jgi:heme-degrading monooxygenase HmoA
MIARIWHGVVPATKADAYERYLTDSERGVDDYRRLPGNLGVALHRRAEGDRVHFQLISWWTDRAAIAAYTGTDIDRAQYFAFDLECLIDPETTVTHHEVVIPPFPVPSRTDPSS